MLQKDEVGSYTRLNKVNVNKNKLRWCRRLDIIIPLPSYNMLFLRSHFLSWEVSVLTGALRFCRNVTPKHVNVAIMAIMAWGPVCSHLANNCFWEKHAFATSWELTSCVANVFELLMFSFYSRGRSHELVAHLFL